MKITLKEFIFPVAGGERATPHAPDTFPPDATFVSFDAETLTVTYTTPPLEEDGEPVVGTRTFTEAEIEAARNWTPPPVVPQTLTRRQFHMAAAAIGVTKESIETAIAAIADPTQKMLAEIDYREAQSFDRTWPTLISMATAVGVTSEQLDQLFIAGASY